MTKKTSYTYDELIQCGYGEMFGKNNAQLPIPPMLMMDRIINITEDAGLYGKGQIIAELDIKKDLWFFECHFHKDPVMPGCLGLDAMWQILGFYLGWTGIPGRGRATGVGRVKFSGQVFPTAKLVTYEINIKKVANRKFALAVADGTLAVDGKVIYEANDLRVIISTDL